MVEYLEHWAGRLVLDGIYLVAMGLIDRSQSCDTSRVVENCKEAALKMGVSPTQIREYDFAAGLDFDEV